MRAAPAFSAHTRNRKLCIRIHCRTSEPQVRAGSTLAAEEISKNITGPRSSQVSLSSPSPRIGSLPAWATIIALLCIAQTLKWGIAGSPANPHWATFETAVLLGINKWNMFERPSQIESGWYETYGY